MELDEYLSISETKKICFFCENGTHARKYRFYANKGKIKIWCCVFCLDRLGGPRAVQTKIEKLELPQDATSFFLNKNSDASLYSMAGAEPTTALAKTPPAKEVVENV